jgi:electron transfer flavoprotein alpha subunit
LFSLQVVEQALKIKGVSKLLVADNAAFKGFLPENLSLLVLACQNQFKFTHILCGGSAFGKTLLPRVAAKLDMSPISDIIGIQSPDTFIRSIYAGNAVLTMKSEEPIKLMTVRSTAFESAALEGGSATEEQAPGGEFNAGTSEFVGQEIHKSGRPELTSARIIISGGEF